MNEPLVIEGAKLEEVALVLPADGAFILALLFPFYWMVGHLGAARRRALPALNQPLYSPFWTAHPTFDHIKNLVQETLFSHVDVEHDADLARRRR